MPAPLVSVILPCYNMGRFIGDALESVAEQTHRNWEILAVDDCGPEDGTREVIESFATRHPEHRVECIRHEKNQGVSAARNTAVAHAKGPLLAFLDPDDAWMPHHLETHLASQESANGINISSSWLSEMSEAGVVQSGKVVGMMFPDIELFPQILSIRNGINPSGVVMSRSVLEEIGGFVTKPELQHVEDWDLWLRLAASGREFLFIQEVTVKYRRHGGAATANHPMMQERIRKLRSEHADLYEDYTIALLTGLLHRVSQMHKDIEALQMSFPIRISRRLGTKIKTLLGRVKSHR